MNIGLIVLGVVILIAVVSAISQMVKSQEEANPRDRRPRGGRSGDGVRTSSGDIDRFLQEIDRLRKKGAPAPVAEKPRPVAKPARQAIPVVEPTRRRREPEPAIPRGDDLPVAAVVPPAARQARAAKMAPPDPAQPHAQTIAGLGRVGGRPAAPVPQTEAGRQLIALLRNPQTVPLAVLLQEVLGPPKCKR
jgi:hypothetical protein